MTWHHDHIGNKAHHPRLFVKCGGDIRREADGTGKMPAINVAHPGWWVYWMLPEAFLNYEDFTAKHVAGSTAGEKGAVTLKLQFAPDASVSEAFGLRVLEHVATIGVEQLAKEEPAAPRRTLLQIHNLEARWHFKGQDTEETEEERTARFAAKRKAQAKAKAEKMAARAAAREAEKAAKKAAALEAGSPEVVERIAAKEELVLITANNDTGFLCVSKSGCKYKAEITEGGVKTYLGNSFATAHAAALEVARYLGKQRSAALAVRAAARSAAASGKTRKRPDEATTSRSGRPVQKPRRV